MPLKAPGKPVTGEKDSSAPALFGTADGRLAPGWTVQQTTSVAAGAGRGLQGTACSGPDTDFWFPGASTAEDRQDYVHLTNPDDTAPSSTSSSTARTAPRELRGRRGDHRSRRAPACPVLLSTLTGGAGHQRRRPRDRPHRPGRAQVSGRRREARRRLGAAVGRPEPGQPCCPASPPTPPPYAWSCFAPGENDADLKVQLATPSGQITPAGHETLHVKAA